MKTVVKSLVLRWACVCALLEFSPVAVPAQEPVSAQETVSARGSVSAQETVSARESLAAQVLVDSPPEDPPAPLYRARDIVAPELLLGEHYEIAELVRLENFMFHFEVRTPWGVVPADGMAMLELRLREMWAIERILALEGNPQFIEGAVEEVLQVPHGAKALLWWPGKTLMRVPAGIRRGVEVRVWKANRRIGCNTHRRMAGQIGCDPETQNPVLGPMLRKTARMKALGVLAGKGTMLAVWPGFAALSSLSRFEESSATELPHESNKWMDGQLRMFGVDEPARRRFFESTAMTTAQRLAYVDYLGRLRGPADLAKLVQGVVETSGEGDALGAIVELKLLGEVVQPAAVDRYEYTGLPMAVLFDGMHVLTCSADLIFETPSLARMIASYREHFALAPTLVVTAGRVTEGARAMFESAAIVVVENGCVDPGDLAAASRKLSEQRMEAAESPSAARR